MMKTNLTRLTKKEVTVQMEPTNLKKRRTRKKAGRLPRKAISSSRSASSSDPLHYIFT